MGEVSLPIKGNVVVPARKSILVIVDMQNEFLKEGGPRFVGETANSVIRKVESLLRKARASNVVRIFLQSTRYDESPEHRIFHRSKHLIEGSWGHKIVEELSPREDEIIVKKFSHDPFNQTELERILSEQMDGNPWDYHVVVGGVVTNVCVYETVTGFSVRNFRVYLPIDCTTSPDPDLHEAALRMLYYPAYSYNVLLTKEEEVRFE